MPRRKAAKSRGLGTDDQALERTLAHAVHSYLTDLRVRHFSPTTVKARTAYLRKFVNWAAEREVWTVDHVTPELLRAYQRHSFHDKGRDGRPLLASTQHARLVPVRQLFAWTAETGLTDTNPASGLKLPKVGDRLPEAVLTADEVAKVLAQPDTTTPEGIRDRAVLETLYCTGIRRAELLALEVTDLDFGRGTLFVRSGKGDRDRFVPLNDPAACWLVRYLDEVRPVFALPASPPVAFLSRRGRALTANWASRTVSAYVEAAGVGKTGSCHLFRHTVATLMLEGGADLRVVQELLGHANVSTTQRYTRVSIEHLRAVHRACHPG